MYKQMVAFNACLSSYRITIERAFGILVSRWLILNSKLKTNIQIIMACVYLHNHCISGYEATHPHQLRSLASYNAWLTNEERYLYVDPNVALMEARPTFLAQLKGIDFGPANDDTDRKMKFVQRLHDYGIR